MGNADAQFNLREMFYIGDGVPQDILKAIFWYGNAADQGVIKAQSRLGEIYLLGQDVPRYLQKAFLWYSKAAGYFKTKENEITKCINKNS